MGTLLTQREKKKGHQSHRQRRDKNAHRGEERGDTVHAKGEDKRTSFTLREKGEDTIHTEWKTRVACTQRKEKKGASFTQKKKLSQHSHSGEAGTEFTQTEEGWIRTPFT